MEEALWRGREAGTVTVRYVGNKGCALSLTISFFPRPLWGLANCLLGEKSGHFQVTVKCPCFEEACDIQGGHLPTSLAFSPADISKVKHS